MPKSQNFINKDYCLKNCSLLVRNVSKESFFYVIFCAINALLYGIFFIYPDFHDMPINGIADVFFVVAQWLLVVLACFALIGALVANKYIFALLYPIITFLCSIAAFFRFTANIVVQGVSIELALVNDIRTSAEVVSIWLILFVLLSTLASIFMVWFRFKHIYIKHNVAMFFVSCALLFSLLSYYRVARPILARTPFNIYVAITDYISSRNIALQQRPPFKGSFKFAPLNTNKWQENNLKVVFILGETAAANHLSINGYKRETTPHLDTLKNVVSLKYVYSQYGFTHTSVPYTLTPADAQNTKLAYTSRSFFDIFKRAGFNTTWIANQEAVDTYAFFMKEANNLLYANAGKSVYVFSKWLDEDMLPLYYKQLKKQHSLSLILLHCIGSHWWYNAHTTEKFEKFKPVATSRVFSSNSPQQLINSYDNTIIYSDNFWFNVIKPLINQRAIVFYLSDHAENLGEDGIWGHGAEHKALHYPAAWVWFSDSYQKTFPQKVEALKANANKKLNSSFLFHSIIDAANIEMSVKIKGNKNDNIFAPANL